MSLGHTSSFKSCDQKVKRKRKLLTIEEKVKILDMLQEGLSYAAVGRKYRLNESTIRYIKKREEKIRHAATFSNYLEAKRAVNVRNGYIVLMESELINWIKDCEKKNISLDTNQIRSKALEFYIMFAFGGRDKTNNGMIEPDINAKPFYASKGWFFKFQKRYNFKCVRLQNDGETAETETSNTYTTEEQVINVNIPLIFIL